MFQNSSDFNTCNKIVQKTPTSCLVHGEKQIFKIEKGSFLILMTS